MFDITPSVLTDEQLQALSDEELSATVWSIHDEQRRRGIEAGDEEALTQDAFIWGFDKAGRARAPQIKTGVLVCPGAKVEKSATSHDCTFVSIDGVWVWDHPDILSDTQRTVTLGKNVRQAVTLIPTWDGMEIDVVTSHARSGPCRMKHVTSYQVRGGTLHPTTTRSAAKTGTHR